MNDERRTCWWGTKWNNFDIFFSFILKCAACIHRYTCSRDANSICSKYIWNLIGFSMETSARLFRCHSDNNNCSLAKCTDFRWILYFFRETFKQSSVTRNWTLNFDLFRRINEGEQSRKLNGFRAPHRVQMTSIPIITDIDFFLPFYLHITKVNKMVLSALSLFAPSICILFLMYCSFERGNNHQYKCLFDKIHKP